MNTQPKKVTARKIGPEIIAKAKPQLNVRDIVPTKDVRGGRTTVKDSRDRYA
ncbi:MAG: hypothetical protein H7X97_05330 [Opitutaceae bacterium]|nr:hypothetical protein [Verrucomicrobiales bacterium]